MLTDYEIARQAGMRPIKDIADKLGVDNEDLLPYGDEVAKVHLNALDRPRKRPGKPRLVLVSATTPTAAGEGKTTTSIGLGQALAWESRVEQRVADTVRSFRSIESICILPVIFMPSRRLIT